MMMISLMWAKQENQTPSVTTVTLVRTAQVAARLTSQVTDRTRCSRHMRRALNRQGVKRDGQEGEDGCSGDIDQQT